MEENKWEGKVFNFGFRFRRRPENPVCRADLLTSGFGHRFNGGGFLLRPNKFIPREFYEGLPRLSSSSRINETHVN